MSITKRNIVKMGDTFRTFPEGAIEFHDDFPVGTYKFTYNSITGPGIEATHDLGTTEPKLYGNAQKRVDKIMSKWNKIDKSLGILASGPKGMGKSLIVNAVAKKAMEDYNLPVFVVDFNFPGIVDFIEENIREAVIVFDEFEKKFKVGEANLSDYDIERRRENRDSDDPDRKDDQTQFLGMFDGMSNHKRLYMLTVNDISKVNNLFINRPGRFHYHFNFDYPDFDAISEYVNDKVTDISDSDVAAIQRLSLLTKISYDHLRAITTELNDNPVNESIDEIVADLNIKNTERVKFTMDIYFQNPAIPPEFNTVMSDDIDENGNYIISIYTKAHDTGRVDSDGDPIRDRSMVIINVPAKDLDFFGTDTKFTIDTMRSHIADKDAGVYDSIDHIKVNRVVQSGTYKSFAAL